MLLTPLIRWHLLGDAPAQGVPPFTKEVLIVAAGVFGLTLIAISILTLVKLIKDIWFSRPATAVRIEAQPEAKGDSKTQHAVLDFAGFVATKDFEEHKAEVHRRAVGLEKQISDLRHEWKDDLQGYVSKAEEVAEETRETLASVNEKSSANGERIASVETKSDLILGILRNLEQRVDRNNERRTAAAP